jgi:DHA1 family multidrug resistance protein-like MFS transporter
VTAPVHDWRRTFWAILAAEVLALAGFSTAMPMIPSFIKHDLGITDPVAWNLWVGACQTVVAVTLMVFAPIWGRLADTRGKRLMLMRATFGGAVAVGLMAVVTRPWQLVSLRALQGMLAGTVAAATVLVAGITPREKAGWALGLLQTGVSGGQSVGPAIGGFVAHLLGNRATFAVSAVLLVAAGAIVLLGVPRDRPTASPGGAIWRRLLPDITPLRANRDLVAVLLICGILQAFTSVAGTILPMFVSTLAGERDASLQTGLVIGVASAAAALGAAVIGRLSWRIGTERTLYLCLWGACLLAIPQGFAATSLQLLVVRAAGAFFLGGTMPALNALIAHRTEAGQQGSVFGLSSAINSAGWAVGPMIGTAVAVGAGYPPVFLVTAAGLAATAVAASVFVPRRAAPQA